MVLSLGRLADEAAQRGDDRAAETLRDAAKMLFADQRIDKVRQRDRKRKADSTGIHRNPAESTAGSQGFSPTPPFPNSPKSLEETPREADPIDAVDAEYASMVEMLQTQLAERLGEHYADVDAFVRRRPFATWKGWLKEIAAQLTGAKTTPADIAQVCRDDECLPRKVESPKGLRVFIRSAVEERLTQNAQNGAPSRPPARPAGGGERLSIGARAFATTRDAIKDL
jgi:hypothetical protein